MHTHIGTCTHRFLPCSSGILTFVPNYFETSTVEESSLPTEHANKILVSIFLTVKATILDTHGSILMKHNSTFSSTSHMVGFSIICQLMDKIDIGRGIC